MTLHGSLDDDILLKGDQAITTPRPVNDLLASVIIPTRNRPVSVESCLDALACQSLPPGSFEVIVVDDGGDPPLSLESARWASKFRLTQIRQERTGPAGARNRGAAEAAGQFLAFTDDDCRPTPTWLEELIAVLRKKPDALVGGATFNGLADNPFSETNQIILEMVYEHFNRNPENAYFFASNNIAVGRDQYQASRGFDPDFGFPAAEDRDFCDRWRMTAKPLIWVESAIIEHRHDQTLAAFCKVYFRYGQGAYLYASKRRERGSGAAADELIFHRHWPAIFLRKSRRYGFLTRGKIVVNLALWQLTNAAGFFDAWMKGRK